MYKINDLLMNIEDNKGMQIKKLIMVGLISYEEVVHALINLNNSKLMIKFAKYVGGYLLNEIENIVIKIGDSYDLLDLAEVPSTNTRILAKEAIKRNDARVMYLFLINVEDAPLKELIKGITASNNAEMIYYSAISIYNSNLDAELKEELLDLLTKGIIATKNAWYIYCYTLNIKSASLKDLSFAMIETEDVESIYKFIIDIEGPFVNDLILRLIELNALDYILRLALLEKSYSHYLTGYIINLGNPEYINLLMIRTNNEELKSNLGIFYNSIACPVKR